MVTIKNKFRDYEIVMDEFINEELYTSNKPVRKKQKSIRGLGGFL